MNCVATFDVGTTALKGVLVSTAGEILKEKSILIETIFKGDYKEQRPQDWYTAFCRISKQFFEEGLQPREVAGIVMSGQMQDLILTARDGRPVCNAVLYSDGRASEQADMIAEKIGAKNLRDSTGNQFDGSLPFSKLLWMKENKPSVYASADKMLISSKDYILTRLTGNFITDVVSASTAGLMDIRKKCWNTAWMEAMALDPEILPDICYAEEQAGAVSEKASAETGFAVSTPVYAGTGDAGATTLAGGIVEEGDFNINLGTTGWIACVSGNIMDKAEVFNLAAMQRNIYINVVPFLNAGNVHKWISGILGPESDADRQYDYIDGLLAHHAAGSHGVMFLPYLTGERFPVMDTVIRGGFAGITPETTKQDMAGSVLEGVAFSIRQGLEAIGRKPGKISLIGGGARVAAWCRILSDVLGHSVCVSQGSEYLPAAATAGAVLVGQGKVRDYASFINYLQNKGDSVCYQPCGENMKLYDRVYADYLKMYPAFKSMQ